MIDTLERDTVIELARHTGWPAVSIHLPTHRSGPGIQQDPIRLRNLLKTAEESLRDGGMRQPDVDSLLRPAREIASDAGFWRESDDGLAIFLAEDSVRVVRVSVPLAELVSVGDRYTVLPVMPAVNSGERFFVLALSKKRVRLMEGSRTEIHELDLSGAPTSLADALKYDDFEHAVQFHSRTPAGAAGRGRRAAVFHGHGGIPEVEKANIERYFRMIDQGIHELLRDDDAPLLLAGVDYLLPIYRAVNSYPHLVAASMTGNPDELAPSSIHTQALVLLEPHFRSEFERDIALLKEMTGTRNTSSDLAEIIHAAHEGRVRVLFVAPGANAWGAYDPSSARVDVHDSPQPGDWDLTDLAASETLLHGGTIHAALPYPTPEVGTAAAIFRY